jgi:hypothetical protein
MAQYASPAIEPGSPVWLDRHKHPDEFGSGHGAMLLWRQHGGAAHSLPWINTGRAEVHEQLAEGGVKGRVTASFADIGMAIASPTLMINERSSSMKRSRRRHRAGQRIEQRDPMRHLAA